MNKYNLNYFLSSLGAGGIAVSFFMYLMFLIPHPNTPLPTFNILISYLLNFNNIQSFIVLFSFIGIIYFSYIHFKLLLWNTKEYFKLKKENNIQNNFNLMILPLTYTMSINVCFILGTIFIPNLWNYVEYLFPLALIGFVINGYFALKIFINVFTLMIFNKNFDLKSNNNFSSLLSVFAFSMIAVGFAAPAAMSHNLIINYISIFCSIFFIIISFLITLFFLPLSIKSIFENGFTVETTPTFLIFIPILTLIGISIVRLFFSFNHNLHFELNSMFLFLITSTIFSLQIFFLLLGLNILKINNYFKTYIYNKENNSSLSFALICPGVALFVFGMFFLNQGLTLNFIIDKFSINYLIILFLLITIQLITIKYYLKLKIKHHI